MTDKDTVVVLVVVVIASWLISGILIGALVFGRPKTWGDLMCWAVALLTGTPGALVVLMCYGMDLIHTWADKKRLPWVRPD